jgi:hypothetical protein
VEFRVGIENGTETVLREEKGKHPERVFTGRPLRQANMRSWRNAPKRSLNGRSWVRGTPT